MIENINLCTHDKIHTYCILVYICIALYKFKRLCMICHITIISIIDVLLFLSSTKLLHILIPTFWVVYPRWESDGTSRRFFLAVRRFLVNVPWLSLLFRVQKSLQSWKKTHLLLQMSSSNLSDIESANNINWNGLWIKIVFILYKIEDSACSITRYWSLESLQCVESSFCCCSVCVLVNAVRQCFLTNINVCH